MLKETFVAHTPKDAFELAKKKYGNLSSLELINARQIMKEDGSIQAEITIKVSESNYLSSIGVDEAKELIDEIARLKDGIEELKAKKLASNQAVLKVTTLLEQKGIQKGWLNEKIKAIKDIKILQDEKLLLSYLLQEIDRGLRVRKEEIKPPLVMMMVGATGVGKTTTIAKLASRYLNITDYKVALINLDTYRAGAHEQLFNFAKLLGISYKQVESIKDFRDILDRWGEFDIILVDTAGVSPYDTTRLIKTIEFLKSTQDREISIELVISATAKYEDIKDIYELFSFINIDSAIVTKFDETRRVGDLIAFLSESHLPVSYISTGQSVPDDIEVATKERILEQFLGEIDG